LGLLSHSAHITTDVILLYVLVFVFPYSKLKYKRFWTQW
jgi:hypothetical protein